MLTGHGDDLYQFERPMLHNFSSNVFYKGIPSDLITYLKAEIGSVINYPSPSAQELNDLAGKLLGISSSQLLFTNGATEAFYLVAQLFSKRRAAVITPSFAEYEDACHVHGLATVFVDIQSFLSYDFTEDVVFFGNPNNPDGTVLSAKEISSLLTKFPKTTFVIDEAYIEFTTAVQSSIPHLEQQSNLLIIRSLTKTFVIPGLRLGYIASSAMQIDQLMQLKMPWSVNTMAVHAGKYLLQNYSRLLFDIQPLMQLTEQFQKALTTIPWLEVLPTNAHYFLVRLKKGKAAILKKHLVEQHQILIRDATNFRGLEGEHIRLATQSEKANTTLVAALKSWNI